MTEEEFRAWCAEVALCEDRQLLKGMVAKAKEGRVPHPLGYEDTYINLLITEVSSRLVTLALRDGFQDYIDIKGRAG